MATVGEDYVGLVDVANSVDPNGAAAMVAEVITKNSAFVEDLRFMQGNLDTGHKHVVEVSLPEVTWRQLYEGVAPSKGVVKPVTDTCGLVEGQSVIDEELLALGGREKAIRGQQAKMFMKAMSNEVETAMFYYSEKTDPEKITGLAPRYSYLPDKWQYDYHSDYRDYVRDGGGSGSDNTSIWLVSHGEGAVYGIFPKGTASGIQTIDRGPVPVLDGDGNRYWAKELDIKWRVGLAIDSYRAVVRIPNISIDSLTNTGDTLVPLMIDAFNRMPMEFRQNAKWYMNSDVANYMDQQARNKTNVWLNIKEYDGMEVTVCKGRPIRQTNAIINTESLVAALT